MQQNHKDKGENYKHKITREEGREDTNRMGEGLFCQLKGRHVSVLCTSCSSKQGPRNVSLFQRVCEVKKVKAIFSVRLRQGLPSALAHSLLQ